MPKSSFKIWSVLLAVLLLSACSHADSKTAEEWFKLTWSGLAGSDELIFHGNAVVYRGDQPKIEESLKYTGQLTDHHQLAIRTIQPPSDEKGMKHGVQPASLHSKPAYKAELLWEGGIWGLQSDPYDARSMGLARLNPLEQLEDIRAVSNKITLENGAARGTRVLRIELDPEGAKEHLQQKLVREMNAIKAGWKGRLNTISEDQRPRVERELEREWAADKELVKSMLSHAEAEVVYHLTINQNTGLPIRLTSETELLYTSDLGVPEREVLLTDSRFEKFR